MAVEHPKIWFPSYPYEWPAEMLYSAAELTLDLALQSLDEGWGLKDATPYNILFEGPKPIFVDICSFERRRAGDTVWQAYGQFMRTFVNPLIASRYHKLPIEALLLAARDGIESEQLYRWTPRFKRYFDLLFLVTLPAMLAKRAGRIKTPDSAEVDPEQAKWVVRRILKGLRKTLEKVRPHQIAHTRWSDYMQTFTYSKDQFEFKSRFVENAITETRPRRTLDVGCNTGYFSKIAAQSGSRVIAIDRDPAVVGQLWKEANAEKLDIQPLVADFARPTPATGWRNAECSSFLARADRAFDMVLLLGTLHHLSVTDRVPVSEVLDQAASVAGHAVIEFVGPGDEMFKLLARGNEDLYRDYTPAAFEQACQARFELVRSAQVPNSHRRLYLLRRR